MEIDIDSEITSYSIAVTITAIIIVVLVLISQSCIYKTQDKCIKMLQDDKIDTNAKLLLAVQCKGNF